MSGKENLLGQYLYPCCCCKCGNYHFYQKQITCYATCTLPSLTSTSPDQISEKIGDSTFKRPPRIALSKASQCTSSHKIEYPIKSVNYRQSESMHSTHIPTSTVGSQIQKDTVDEEIMVAPSMETKAVITNVDANKCSKRSSIQQKYNSPCRSVTINDRSKCSKCNKYIVSN